MLRQFLRVAAVAAGLVGGAGPAWPQGQALQTPPPQSVSGPEISMLIRTTLIALDQANKTGNYTVLRDLTADRLRRQNSAAQLAEMFQAFRARNINLAPTVLVDARLPKGPQLTTDGFLRLQGFFPTRPEEVVFDMSFFYEGGQWRIGSVNVGTRQPAGPDATPARLPVAPQAAAPPIPKPRPEPSGLNSALSDAAKRYRKSQSPGSSAP